MNKQFNQTGNHLEVAGAQIYYEEIANAGKPTLLFLHGGMGNITDFNPIIPLFANDYHIVGIDSRGHGKSTLGAEGLTYKRLQLDAEAIINHLQLKDVNIIGFSDGGVVAYRLALSSDISVQKIVTIGAVCNDFAPESNERLFAGVTTEQFIEGFQHNFDFYAQHNPQPNASAFIKRTEKMWFDKSEDGYPNIANIKIPTLIVRGNDELDPLEEYVEMVAKIPNSILFNIPFESHTPVFEKYPHIFAEVVKDFFNSEGLALYAVTENYSGNKVTFEKGETVEAAMEQDGWLWVKKKTTREMAWIPLEMLGKIGN